MIDRILQFECCVTTICNFSAISTNVLEYNYSIKDKGFHKSNRKKGFGKEKMKQI